MSEPAASKRARAMRIYDGQNKELMTVRKLERDGNDLVITGKIFGAMPMKARLKPEEARAGAEDAEPQSRLVSAHHPVPAEQGREIALARGDQGEAARLPRRRKLGA